MKRIIFMAMLASAILYGTANMAEKLGKQLVSQQTKQIQQLQAAGLGEFISPKGK